jgi:hypothetical protein
MPGALVVVAFCISCARAMRPGDAPESRRPARGVGGRRSAGHKDTRGSPVDSRSAWVTGCPGIDDTLSGEGRAAHARRAWQRPSPEQTREEGCGCCGGWARGCSYVLRNGQAAHHWARSRPGTRGAGAAARWYHEGESDDMPEAEPVYVAHSEPATWVYGGGRAGVAERAPIFDRYNHRALKLDGIRGGSVSLPGGTIEQQGTDEGRSRETPRGTDGEHLPRG